jgi:thymidylate synthase ThyX
MSEEFTPEERAALAPYVTNLDSPIFALRNLPEEVVAVLFAYYSRSRDSLRRNLLKLLSEGDLDLASSGVITQEIPSEDYLQTARDKARTFHEKWVVGYGHASVAEHGCVHLALEGVSIIASKLIEDTRLASYTEKSTRYVAFDTGHTYTPPSVQQDPELSVLYADTIKSLLESYTDWTEDFVAKIKAITPKTEKQTDRSYDNACRATAYDNLRYLLPTAVHTNIGLTINARALETLISKLLSQPLPEGQLLGKRIKEEAAHIVPTLLKYADHSTYRADTPVAISALISELADAEVVPEVSSVRVTWHDTDADNRLIASILYDRSSLSLEALQAKAADLSIEAKERVVDEYLFRRGKHDAPGRALERIFCTSEIVMDYGAYRDVQRHRMATQSLQPLGTALGYEIPPMIEQFGYKDRYDLLMASAAAAFAAIQSADSDAAQYVLPLATRVRALFTWNLRSITHFIELRSARQGHPSYRRTAQQLFREIERVYPLVGRYIRPNMKNYSLTRD